MGFDAIIALGGLIIPPVFDFIKKKFIKAGKDTPEATMSSLATTKPEALEGYVTAMATYLDAQTRFFNRDIVGQSIPPWVSATRAMIKPAVVIFGIVHLVSWKLFNVPVDDGVKYFYIAVISAWFGIGISKD